MLYRPAARPVNTYSPWLSATIDRFVEPDKATSAPATKACEESVIRPRKSTAIATPNIKKNGKKRSILTRRIAYPALAPPSPGNLYTFFTLQPALLVTPDPLSQEE